MVDTDQQDIKQESSERYDLIGVVLRIPTSEGYPSLWLVRRGRLCDDVCFGHDSCREVSRGALDSENDSTLQVSWWGRR